MKIRSYCIGCGEIYHHKFFTPLCDQCDALVYETKNRVASIVAKNNLWQGHLIHCGHFKGVLGNLLKEAKINSNLHAQRIITRKINQVLAPMLIHMKIQKIIVPQQSAYSYFKGKTDMALLIAKCIQKNLKIPITRSRYLPHLMKNSFFQKAKRARMIFENPIQWRLKKNYRFLIVDDVVSSGQTVDKIVCEQRNFEDILVITWASSHNY